MHRRQATRVRFIVGRVGEPVKALRYRGEWLALRNVIAGCDTGHLRA